MHVEIKNNKHIFEIELYFEKYKNAFINSNYKLIIFI